MGGCDVGDGVQPWIWAACGPTFGLKIGVVTTRQIDATVREVAMIVREAFGGIRLCDDGEVV